MIIKHECKVCSNKFELTNGETLREIKQGEFIVTYVDCPKCRVTSVVQVDNEETKKILGEIIKKIRTINVTKMKTRRQSAQLKNLNTRLDKKRKELYEYFKSNCAVTIEEKID